MAMMVVLGAMMGWLKMDSEASGSHCIHPLDHSTQLKTTQKETYVNVKLRIRSHIPNPRMLPRQSTYRRIRKPITNTTTHQTQTLNMLCYLGKCSKQKSNVSQGPSCNHPRRPLRLRQKRIPHGEDRILVCDRWPRGFGEEICTIETRVA